MRKKISQALITGVAAFGLVGVAAGVAVADSSSALACTLRADVPNSNNDAVVGREGCSNTVDGEGRIREDRNAWPDDTVGSISGGGWGTKTVNGSCGNGRGSYYSDFKSSTGASAASSRATRC
ncbi:hypothetical protein [Plantactinospora sp. WMMB782]|uniref:hypothetical protein n=1 Tax=Plantactinospora sp. WMMB782 TaxID=3404121 RepID=UPI003B940B64